MGRESGFDTHILNIIQTEAIQEQSDLQGLLRARGFDIPQATLSRHLKRLKIAKVGGIYRLVEVNQAALPPVLNMQVSEFGLIILHTHPGNANSIAYFIDQKYVASQPKKDKDSGILGTIAGDDTILLIIKSKADLPRVLAILEAEFPYLGV